MSERRQLGVVTTRSGGLLVIDTGYLRIWSHDKVPFLPEGLLSSEECTRRANASVDLRIVGKDAERAGRMLGMSWHPLFVFDQDPDHPELEGKLKQVVRDNELDARFEVISPRTPHRERVNLALQH